MLDVRQSRTLEQALHAWHVGDLMSGENSLMCETCRHKSSVRMMHYFSQLPDTLVLQLKRFDISWNDRGEVSVIKLNDRVSFPFQLDVAPYSSPEAVATVGGADGATYKL